MKCCFISRTLVLTLPLISAGMVLADVAASRPATRAATSPATQPTESLMSELARTVEIAQQKLRAAKPPSPPPANSLQRAHAAAPPDVFTPLAQELVGKTGLVAFDVVDVYDNNMLVVGPPPVVSEFRHAMPYLVRAECDSQTSARLSEAQQRIVRGRQARGDVDAAAKARDAAEAAKPKHLLWIMSDDETVKNWARRSRQKARCEVISASLRSTTNGYVQVVTVLKTLPRSPATAPATQPTGS